MRTRRRRRHRRLSQWLMRCRCPRLRLSRRRPRRQRRRRRRPTLMLRRRRRLLRRRKVGRSKVDEGVEYGSAKWLKNANN